MRLSEAIRLGAMITPQVYGTLFDPWNNGTCALGAAYYSVDKNFAFSMKFNSVNHFPILGKRDLYKHPVNGNYGKLHSIIISLNDDDYCWTREQIADWVEIIEVQEEAKNISAVVDVESSLVR